MAKRKRTDAIRDVSPTGPQHFSKTGTISKTASKSKPQPSPVLLDLVHTFLKGHEYHNTARALSIDSRFQKTTAPFNGAARGVPDLAELYDLWSKQQEPGELLPILSTASDSPESVSDFSEDGDKNLEIKEREDNGAESESESDSDSKSKESNSNVKKPHAAPEITSSSSDESSEEDNHLSTGSPSKSGLPVKEKSPSSASSSNVSAESSSDSESSSEAESESESESESEVEQKSQKKPKISEGNKPMQKRVERTASLNSSSGSEDDSGESSGENSESESSSSSESDRVENTKVDGSASEESNSESASDESSDGDSDSSSDSEEVPPKAELKPPQKKVSRDGSDSNASASSSTLKGSSDHSTEKPTIAGRASTESKTATPSKRKRDSPAADSAPISTGKRVKQNNEPFSRIPKNFQVDPRFASNKYVSYDYADRAHQDLSVTKGKGFTKEKNKKKRGSYRGGYIDMTPKGIKFDD